MLVYLTDNCNPTCSDGSYWFGNAPNDWWLQPTSHGFFSAPVIRSSFWTVVATWPPKRSPFPCPWRYLCWYLCLTCTYRHCSPCCWHLHSMSSYLDCLLTPLSMSDSPTNQTILKHLVHINIPIFVGCSPEYSPKSHHFPSFSQWGPSARFYYQIIYL